jgi:hypothetical protein
LGYIIPDYLKNKVTGYLIKNSNNYAKAASEIFPVDLAKIYNENNNLSINDEITDVYDEYKLKSTYAVDNLPLMGLEKNYNPKKINSIIRYFNIKH